MTSPFIWLQHALPHHLVSRGAGKIASSRTPWLKNLLIRRFVDAYDVDMSEAARTIDEFASFNDFFTRELKPGARPLGDASTQILSPADGAVSQIGRIEQGRIFQAKGRHFTAAQLLGGDEKTAHQFDGGSFATIYLSPRDYHRVHMPVTGTLREMVYVPGRLFSVNKATANHVPGLFARNERLVCLFDTEHGPLAMVLVGAMIVAAIETVWAGQVTPLSGRVQTTRFDEPIVIEKGQEMGRFKLGSTVVMCFGHDVAFRDVCTDGLVVSMGQPLAS